MYTVAVTSRAGTRERILKVSKALFAARGYEHSSTSAIARAAETSESQLIKHFGSKAGLLDAMFAEGWSSITGEIRAAVAGIASPIEKLQSISRLALEAIERDPEMKLLMLMEGRRIRREGPLITLTDGFMSLVQLIDEVLEQMRASGQLRPNLEPQAVRSALMGMFEGMLRDRFLAGRVAYPASFDAGQIGALIGLTLNACVNPGSQETVLPATSPQSSPRSADRPA